MRLLFLGTAPFALSSLRELARSRHRITAVVTQPDRPKGRGRAPQPPAIKEEALALKLPLLQPEQPKELEFLKQAKELAPDCAVVVAYGCLLPEKFLTLFPHGAINLHASLLPKHRGAAPIQWSILRGDRETGVTIFQLDRELDHGPILLQERIPIEATDDAVSLSEKLSQLGAGCLLRALDQLEAGKLRPIPQEHAQATSAPRLKKENGLMDWKQDAVALDRQIRAVQPWPGAQTWLNGKLLKILKATPDLARPASGQPPGSITQADPREGLWIQAGKGQLRLNRLQEEGGRPTDSTDFLRGHPLKVGTLLQSKQA